MENSMLKESVVSQIYGIWSTPGQEDRAGPFIRKFGQPPRTFVWWSVQSLVLTPISLSLFFKKKSLSADCMQIFKQTLKAVFGNIMSISHLVSISSEDDKH